MNSKYIILGCKSNSQSKEHPMLMACYWLKDDNALVNGVKSLVDDVDQTDDIVKAVKSGNGFAYFKHGETMFKVIQTSDIETL